MELLARQGRAEYRAVQEMALTRGDLEWADIALLGRLDSWYEHRLAEALKRAGVCLVYIMDDDLLNVPAPVNSASYYGLPEIRRHIRDIIAMSDALLSPSPLLLERYGGGKASISIEEPAIDPMPFAPHSPGAPVKIGFAGSVDRAGDLEDTLREALFAVRDACGDGVVFEFFGAVPDFATALDARVYPYCDSYEQYRHRLNGLGWDIGLAPMPDTPFHACKHYNKFCEYAAAGITGIFSRVSPYTRLDAFPGCATLCENTPEAWTKAIRRLVDDCDLRERLREAASRCALGPLSVEASAEGLLRGLEALPLPEGRGRVRGMLALWKASNLLCRTVTSMKAHGPAEFARIAVGKAVAGLKGRPGTGD